MKIIDPNNKDQIADIAAQLVEHSRATYPGAGGWRGSHGDKALQAFEKAADLIRQYPEKLAKLQSGELRRAEAREWFSNVYAQLNGATAASTTASQHALNAYKSAEVGILAAFADAGLPTIEVTAEQLVRAATRFKLEYDGDVICMCYPDFVASVFDGNVRRAFKGVRLYIPLGHGHDKSSWTYETDGAKCAAGHPNQFHPHILSSSRPCWGGSGNIVATAMQEGRIADALDTMFELLEYPRDDSLPHLMDIASMPGSEAKCQKCGKWHKWGEYGDDPDLQVIKYSKVDGKDDQYQYHVLCDANFVTCPETGKRFPQNKGVKYNGVYYHKSGLVGIVNSHGLPESVPKSMCAYLAGQWHLKSSVQTCCVTGIPGLAIKADDSGKYITKSPLDLVPLEGGKHVLACCLDLVDQYGPLTLEGIINVPEQQKPWWQNRIDTRPWSKFSPWVKHIASRYPDLAARLAKAAAQA